MSKLDVNAQKDTTEYQAQGWDDDKERVDGHVDSVQQHPGHGAVLRHSKKTHTYLFIAKCYSQLDKVIITLILFLLVSQLFFYHKKNFIFSNYELIN